MLKLRYLFDNRDLAVMLLQNWEYDKSSLSLMDQFRISSNAIYPFKQNGQVCLLRFSPEEEKKKKFIQAELEFMGFLRQEGYVAAPVVQSKSGCNSICQNTPWGNYNACVFRRVKGKRLDGIELTDDILFKYGKALGFLHVHSQKYHPEGVS